MSGRAKPAAEAVGVGGDERVLPPLIPETHGLLPARAYSHPLDLRDAGLAHQPPPPPPVLPLSADEGAGRIPSVPQPRQPPQVPLRPRRPPAAGVLFSPLGRPALQMVEAPELWGGRRMTQWSSSTGDFPSFLPTV